MFNVLDPINLCIISFALGCGLVICEVFFPSGGILGFLAAVCIVGAVIMAFIYEGPASGAAFLVSSVVMIPILLAVAFKILPNTPIGKVLLGELPDEQEVAPQDDRRELIGRTGIARSKMLPSGSIEVEGQIYDAVSRGQAIEPGQRIVVCEVRSNRVMVRPAKEDEKLTESRQSDVLSQPLDELGIESLDDPLA